MPTARRFLHSMLLAVLLLAGLRPRAALAQEPADAWFVRVPCRDEATFVALLDADLRVILWWDGQVYALAGAAQRAGLAVEALHRQPSRGRYYVIWAFAPEAEELRQRYGTLAALGDGFYLLGLPPGAELTPGEGPRYAHPLPHSMQAPRPASPAILSPPPAPPALGEIVASVSQARLTQDIATLQDDPDLPGDDALGSRYTLSPGLDAAAAYIAAELEAAGLEVSFSPFRYVRQVNNVVGTLPGLLPESQGFFILCAHYDSTAGASPGWATNWQNMPAPGADDNGSGTAAVLEAARALGGHQLAYTVRFVFLAGEEQGLRGSEAYAEALAAQGANILGVINLDMIGYDANGDGVVEVHTGCTAASQALGEALVRNARRYAPTLQPDVETVYANVGSDQAAFWSRGYPAILLIEDWGKDANFRYHTVNDRLSALNMTYCTNIARAVVATVGELAQLQAPADLSTSQRTATYDRREGGTVNYTITLRNTGSAGRAMVTDILPPQLSLLGPAVASRGTATWDEATRRVSWSGEIGPQGTVVISYRAALDPALRGQLVVRHAAYLSTGAGREYELPAEASVGWRFLLPLIVRR